MYLLLFILRDVRETWIKAKYVDKIFVRKLSDITNPHRRSSRTSLMDVRKWSVRKLRRRTRSCDNSKKNKQRNHKLKLNASNDDNSTKSIDKKTDDSPHNSLLLFGSELEKQPLDDSLELSSDQDSTGGEDEEDYKIGSKFFVVWRGDIL